MRRINKLIIVGGPSAAGKTYLIKKMQKGKLPNLCKQIEVPSPLIFPDILVKDFPSLSNLNIPGLIVHYDFCAQYSSGEYSHIFNLLKKSDNIIVLTLKTPLKTLIKRNIRRIFILSLYSIILLKFSLKNSAIYKKTQNKILKKLEMHQKYSKGHDAFLYKEWDRVLRNFPINACWEINGNWKNEKKLVLPGIRE